MKPLDGKTIVVGVTGGIAAYKAVDLTSRLKKMGADVFVIMTKAAQNFVGELTFREISRNPVSVSMWQRSFAWNVEHIALAERADLVVVAPATANFVAKAAHGIADDMLSTVLLATKAPIFLAPAMNCNMFLNGITQKNLAMLKEQGVFVIEPATGQLACGAEGIGRLPEPADIAETIKYFFAKKNSLAGKKIIVTAGGTIAPVDPVRFVGNYSSGKMGCAAAEEAAVRGANVVLVAGKMNISPPPNVRTIKAETTQEMYEAALAEFADADAVIKAAAVADYRVKNPSPQKIKKSGDKLIVEFERAPDILRELGARKRRGQVLVGFAAETENVSEYATRKLQEKNLDFIVANDVTKEGAGFQNDTNIAMIISADGSVKKYPLMQKRKLAGIILDCIEEKFGLAETQV